MTVVWKRDRPTGERTVLVVSAGRGLSRHAVQPALATSAERQNPVRNRALARRSAHGALIGGTAT